MALLLLLGTTPSKAATLGLYSVPTLLNLSELRILGAKPEALGRWEGPGHPRSGREPRRMFQLPCCGREKRGDAKQVGTRIIFKQPTAVQWFGKLCGGLSQGGELIGDFPSACQERESH